MPFPFACRFLSPSFVLAVALLGSFLLPSSAPILRAVFAHPSSESASLFEPEDGAGTNCGWNAPGGQIYDFSTLTQSDLSYSGGGFKYALRLCGVLQTTLACSPTGANVSACQVQAGSGHAWDIGNWPGENTVSWRFLDEANPGTGVGFTMQGGTNWSTNRLARIETEEMERCTVLINGLSFLHLLFVLPCVVRLLLQLQWGSDGAVRYRRANPLLGQPEAAASDA
jgi:hypothetical protein